MIQRLDLAISGTGDGLWDWDVSTNVVWFARRFKELLGYADEEFQDRFENWAAHLHPDDVERTFEALRMHLEKGQRFDTECRLRTKTGDYRWFRARGEAVRDELGAPIRMAGSIQDITDRKLAEQELKSPRPSENGSRRVRKLYNKAHRFVDNVSHELRTPLTVIKEYTALLREGVAGAVNGDQAMMLDVIGDRADDLNRMVDNMLDVAKLQAGMLGAWRKTRRVHEIVRSVVPTLERKATIRGVTLEIDIDDELPEAYCDGEKAGRVIVNLTVNAIKSCREDGFVCIWAKEDEISSDLVVGVTDNGSGIDPGSLNVIFEQFKPLETDAYSSCKGFGLGLSVAKELVDLNFGSMSVASELGKGSTFTFTLPPADPIEVMRRYLHRVEHVRNDSSAVSLFAVEVEERVDASLADDVDAYLHDLLRWHDLLFPTGERRWLLAIQERETEEFFTRAAKRLKKLNRSRIANPLPRFSYQPLGAWRVGDQTKDILQCARKALASSETRHPRPALHALGR